MEAAEPVDLEDLEDLEEEEADMKRLNATNYQIVLLTVSARAYRAGAWIPALIMWKQGGLRVE